MRHKPVRSLSAGKGNRFNNSQKRKRGNLKESKTLACLRASIWAGC